MVFYTDMNYESQIQENSKAPRNAKQVCAHRICSEADVEVVVDGCVMLLIRCLFIYCNKGPSFILTKSKSLICLQTVPTNDTVGL